MRNEMAKNSLLNFQDVGFLTGKELTLAGIRAVSTNFNGKLKEGSARVGLQFFYKYKNRDGKTLIMSGFAHLGAWNNNLKPSKNRKGFIIPNGADKPGVEKGSELHMYIEALVNLDMPKEVFEDMSDLSGMLGTVLMLAEKPVKNQRRAKKSVDPDDAAAPAKERTTEIPVKIVLLPGDNPKFKPLTDEQIDEHLEEKSKRSKARKAASSSDDDEDVEVETDDDEAEDDDAEDKDDDADSGDESGGDDDDDNEDAASDDDADEGGDGEDSSDDDSSDDEPEEKPEPKAANPHAVKAADLIRRALKGKKAGLSVADLARAIHPFVKDEDKKTRAEVTKLVQTSSFVERVRNVSVKNGKVKLAE